MVIRGTRTTKSVMRRQARGTRAAWRRAGLAGCPVMVAAEAVAVAGPAAAQVRSPPCELAENVHLYTSHSQKGAELGLPCVGRERHVSRRGVQPDKKSRAGFGQHRHVVYGHVGGSRRRCGP